MIHDPCCGTGGFLIEAFKHTRGKLGDNATAEGIEVLHGVDEPHLWHGTTLTGNETYGGLFQEAPAPFDVLLTNPPFGGKEGKEAQLLRVPPRHAGGTLHAHTGGTLEVIAPALGTG